MVGVTTGYLELRRAALDHVLPPADAIAFAANPAASAPPTLRVLTGLGVLTRALWLLLVPLRLSADYSYAHIPVVASSAEPVAIAGLLAAATLLALAAIVRRHPAALFWYAFALLAWGPVSNLPFPIDTIFRERLLYLPSAGFCALLAMALLRPARGPWRAAVAALAAVLVLGWGVRAGRRNFTWHDQRSLAESMVASAPDSAYAHAGLGTVYSGVGRDDDALREFSQALAINPKDTGTLYNAGVVYQRRGQWLEALTVFRRVTSLDPAYLPAWINFAAVNNSQAMFAPALDAADRALALRPDVPNAHVVRGFALRGLGRLDESRAAFQEALRLAPGLPDALLGLGATAIERGDFGEAAQAFERLVATAPSADVYRGLVYSYRMAGRDEDAARASAAGHERFPDDAWFAPEAGQRDHQ
jgi:tetratricopeptide (TPR) repeat protein